MAKQLDALQQRIRQAATANPSATHAQIAQQVGCHPGTVGKHLQGRRKPASRTSQTAAATLKTEPAETRAAAVQRMALNRSPEHDRVLAAMSECPSEVLRDLSRSRDSDVMLAVARNPSTDGWDLSQLAVERNGAEIVAAVAKNRSTPAWCLKKLVDDCEDPQVAQALASNPLIGHYEYEKNGMRHDSHLGSALLTLAHNHPAAHKAILKNPNVGRYVLSAVVRKAVDTDTKIKALRDRRCDRETREQAASGPNPRVRAAAAGAPNIGRTVYERLLADPEPAVRAAAATNPRLDDRKQGHYVQRIMQDAEPAVRASLAKYIERRSVVRELARDPDPAVRSAAAANPHRRRWLLRVIRRQR